MNKTPIPIVKGGYFKLQLLIDDLPSGLDMEAVSFTCTFFGTQSQLRVEKRQMLNPSPGVYVVPLDSYSLGRGPVWVDVSLEMPDADFPGEVRRETHHIDSGIIII